MTTLPNAIDPSVSVQRDALRCFGYDPNEAAFLTLTAFSGGYFVRRQAAQFLGKRDGGTVTQLVQKALDLNHARCSTWAKAVHLYHLGSRPFYASLGEPDNRNRRRHEISQIKNRLMCLDFLLTRRDAAILATERDRVHFFDRLGVARELLPQKCFNSRSGSRSTTRYFLERQPLIAERRTGSCELSLTFAFVDEGLVTLSRFKRFLEEHTRLLATLKDFTLIYVADSPRHFAGAAALTASLVDGGADRKLPLGQGPHARLLAYFELKKRYEQREFAAFDREQLLQLRDGKNTFSGPEIEAQYRRWLAGETLATTALSTTDTSVTPPLSRRFSTELLAHDYALFGHFLP